MLTRRFVCLITILTISLFAVAVARAADAERKEGDTGTFTGTVTKKIVNATTTCFGAKSADGTTEIFFPKWIGGNPNKGGGFDKDIVAKIKELHVGDKVEVKWVYAEHLRALDIKVTEKAPAEPKKPEEPKK